MKLNPTTYRPSIADSKPAEYELCPDCEQDSHKEELLKRLGVEIKEKICTTHQELSKFFE